MFKHLISALTANIIAVVSMPFISSSAEDKIPEGWLMWHSYTDYLSMDSALFVQAPDGEITEITGSFTHAMNGSFGSFPGDIVFMAIDLSANEWDIYRFNRTSGTVVNLTPNSGFRNEDPKFSPNGRKIVFKRGYWDNNISDFAYDIAELDLYTGEITMLTDDIYEDAMPCYSSEGDYIYYTKYSGGFSSICRINTETHEAETVFSEENTVSYYPQCCNENLYFTKWYSEENHCDCIMRYDGKNTAAMPFNSQDYNCSDAFPVSDDSIIYSSTRNGSYDLFYYNGTDSVALSELNSEKQELGAAFYTKADFRSFISGLQSFILGKECPAVNYDVNGDGFVDSFDAGICRAYEKSL